MMRVASELCGSRSDSEVSVVQPQESSRGRTDSCNRPPDAVRLMCDFTEVMHECAAEPSADQ